jgi:hypothetical protein
MTKTRSRATALQGRTIAQRQSDDLKRIRGIGPVAERHLRKAGIRSFAQLAATTPDHLAASTGLSVHRVLKGNWIEQARKLGRQKAQSRRVKSARVPWDQQHYATFTIELLLNKDNGVRRTRIVHIQSAVEEVGPDWDPTRLVSFLASRAGIRARLPEPLPLPALATLPQQLSGAYSRSSGDESPLLTEATSPPAATSPIAETPPPSVVEANFYSVPRVTELATTPSDLDVPQGMLYVGRAFSVHFSLDLSRVEKLINTPLIFTATVWAKKLGEKSRQIVGEKQGTAMSGDKFTCTVEVTITSEGAYRLEAVVIFRQHDEESSIQDRLVAMQRSRLLQVC